MSSSNSELRTAVMTKISGGFTQYYMEILRYLLTIILPFGVI